MAAAVASGYPKTNDFDGSIMEGPAWVNFSVKDQRRPSSQNNGVDVAELIKRPCL